MLCQAPELPISLARHQEVPERPDEFGFKLDDVQSLMALNNTNFIYYPNPEFEPLSVSGVLELKPGSPIILKVSRQGLPALTYHQSLLIQVLTQTRCTLWETVGIFPTLGKWLFLFLVNLAAEFLKAFGILVKKTDMQ